MWDGVRSRLAQLARLDSDPRELGAASHRYRLRPVATPAEVSEAEARYGVALPEDYRAYMLTMGNGGAGPYYGVFRLGCYRDGSDFYPWHEGPFPTSPGSPFVLTEAWNLPAHYLRERDDGDPSAQSEQDAVAALADAGVIVRRPSGNIIGKNPFNGEPVLETWDSLIMAGAAGNSLMNGTIPITTQGCGLGVSLVVSGPERGHVWFDLRADQNGVAPATSPTRPRLTFFQWYDAWLDDALARRSGNPP